VRVKLKYLGLLIAFAHGGLVHVLGTVSETSPSTVTVTTTENKKVVVALDAKTQFVKSGVNVTAQDVKVGDRVVIHAKKDGDKLLAQTIQVGVTKTH
jgi:hypothetical protein